jgi:CubicO group peptidase (beta-lactamase class C family)
MPSWLAPALTYLPQWLDTQIAQAGFPGASLAVAHGGAPVLAHATGVASLATGEKLTPAHRFRVASHSKTFTTVGILRLAEAGRLRLDDRVGTHVAGLHPEIARARVGQLLSHSAGIIRDGTDAGQWQDRRPFLNEAELRAALAEPPVLPPNTRFKYSNHAYGLAGLVIEAVTGEPYTAWIAREVVARAGLASTIPDAPLPPETPFARGHGGPALTGSRFVIPADNPTNALAAATGFISTPSDLAVFFSQLDPAARTRLLSAESRREMTRRHWRIPDMAAERHYGLGTAQGDVGDWSWFGHGGGFQGVRSFTLAAPAARVALSIAVHAADADPNPLAENGLRILRHFALNGPPTKRTAAWTGRFWSLWGATDLVPAGDRVFLAQPGQANPFADVSEVTVTGPDEGRITRATGYGSHGERAALVRNRAGKVVAVQLGGSRLTERAAAIREARERYGA